LSQQRRRIQWFWWAILAVVLLFGIWQLASLFQLLSFNVDATVGELQPGDVAEIKTNWSEPEVPSSNGTTEDGGGASFGTDWGPAGAGDGGTGDEGMGPEPEGLVYEGPPPRSGGGGGTGPGVTIVENTNNNGDKIYVEPDELDFGYVFPGEVVTLYFTVHLEDDVTGTITYSVEMVVPDGGFGSANDIRPYLVVERDPAEDPEAEPDDIADGTKTPIPDYEAEGTVTDNVDESDVWLVTFYVPYETGDYWAWIRVEVD